MSLPKYINPPPVPEKKELTRGELRDAIDFNYKKLVRMSSEMRQIQEHIENLKVKLWR